MDTIKPTWCEPKKNNRFLVEFPEEFDIKSWSIEKINKPKYTDDKWENIRVDFIDPIGPSTSQRLFEIVNFLKKNNGGDKNLFEVNIKSLDQKGVVVEEWVIYVEKVIAINFGDLEYSSYEIQKPFLILKPLYCILKY